jgi:hypothetical protein
MEFLGEDVKDIFIDEDNSKIKITYANDGVEEMTKGPAGYSIMHREWLVQQPPFISDIFKVQMRDITLVTINNDNKCLDNLNSFFINENKEEVKKFIKYMRERDAKVEQAKALWTVRQ